MPTQQEALSFENDAYTIEANKLPGCRFEAQVHVKPSATADAYKKAIKKVNKQISIPGFRKGRAPDATVIKNYSSYVEQEWKELLMQDALQNTFKLTNIYPMNKESLDKPKLNSCDQEKGADFTFTYECYPDLPKLDLSSITLPDIPKEEVSNARLEEIILEVRRDHCEFEDVEARSAKAGDCIEITLESLEEEPPKPIVSKRRLDLEEGKLAPWLTALLIGMSPEESKEGMSELDDKAPAEAKKNFKPMRVKVTLHAIYERKLPELNDEFAKKLGLDSVDVLKEKISENIEQENLRVQREKRIDALNEALLKAYTFDLPSSLVEREEKERLKLQLQALKDEQNLSDEELSKHQKEIESEVKQITERSLRLYFINKQIASQGELSVSNDELNNELMRQMQSNPQLIQQMQQGEKISEEMVSRLASTLMQNKTHDYALSKVLGDEEKKS